MTSTEHKLNFAEFESMPLDEQLQVVIDLNIEAAAQEGATISRSEVAQQISKFVADNYPQDFSS